MSKPARLYPKPEPVKVNPRTIWFGSIIFAVFLGWIGFSTLFYGVL